MSWIICNACLMKPKQLKDRNFKLTSCGHIFCSSCIEGDDRGICALCRNDTRMILLSEEMDASIKEYFSSPDEMLSRAVNVLKFQNAQQGIIQQNFHQLRTRFEDMRSRFDEMKKKYEAAKGEIRKLYDTISNKDNRIRNLENELANAQKKLTPNLNLSSLNCRAQSVSGFIPIPQKNIMTNFKSNSEPRTQLTRTRLSLPFHSPSPKSPSQLKNTPWQSNSIIGSASRNTPSPNRFTPYIWQNMKRAGSAGRPIPPSPSPTGTLSQNLNRLQIPSPTTAASVLSQQNRWRPSNLNNASRFSMPTTLRQRFP